MKKAAKSLLLGTVGAAGLLFASANHARADTTVKVKANDTVWSLSKKYGVSIKSIEKLNKIDGSSHLIVAGQTLTIPGKGAATKSTTSTTTTTTTTKTASTSTKSTYTVKAGDSLWSVAKKHGLSVAKLRALNNLSSNLIYAGQTLKVTGTASTTSQASSTTASTTASTTSASSSSSSATSSSASSYSTTKTQVAGISSDATGSSTTSTSSSATSSSATSSSAASSSSVKKTTSKSTKKSTSSTTVTGAAIASYASYLATKNIPYVSGGTSLSGFDCSGFVQYVYKHFGISLPRTSQAQSLVGTAKSLSNAKVGDILFWGSRGSSYHCGIYLGGTKYVAAPTEGETVSVKDYTYYKPTFAVHVSGVN